MTDFVVTEGEKKNENQQIGEKGENMLSKQANIRAILEANFNGFKDEIIDTALHSIMLLDLNDDFIYGYSVKELIVFASLCREKGISDLALYNFVNDVNMGFRLGMEKWNEQMDKSLAEYMNRSEKGNVEVE